MRKYLMYVVALALSVAVAACATPYQPTEVPRPAVLAADARVVTEQAQRVTEQAQRVTEQARRATEQIERKYGPPPTPSSASTPPAPRPTLSSGEEISLAKVGGVYELPVEINGVLTLNFVLDSGASEVLIPADVVFTLVRTGTIKDTDFLPGKTGLGHRVGHLGSMMVPDHP